MTTILELPSAWRAYLMPASFNGARFHCDANAMESGRRIVEHQFPKKDLPYAEDMGRHAREFTIRGYCIVYPRDQDDLFQRDYRQPRDALILALEAEGPGTLQLPTRPAQVVVCTRFRFSEEDRFGGFCTFDMTFAEYGMPPQDYAAGVATATIVQQASQVLRDQAVQALAPPPIPALSA
jgi:prophage DNA circulation protein